MGARGGRSSLGELSSSKFPDWAAAEKGQTFVFSFPPFNPRLPARCRNRTALAEPGYRVGHIITKIAPPVHRYSRFSSRSASATSKEELTCLDRYQAGGFDLARNIPDSSPLPSANDPPEDL